MEQLLQGFVIFSEFENLEKPLIKILPKLKSNLLIIFNLNCLLMFMVLLKES